MPDAPRGTLQTDGTVLVPDQAEANRLYNKGFAGHPVRGGALALDLLEATRLVEEERLTVQDDAGQVLPYAALLERGVALDRRFEIPLFAYSDLRARGLVTKLARKRTLDFLVYPRGTVPKGTHAEWLCGAFSEREPVSATRLLSWLDEADEEEAALVLSIIDEEGDVTHYSASRGRVGPAATGSARSAATLEAAAERPLQARFLVDRVVAWGQAATALHEDRFVGRPLPGGIQLSLVEAAALLDMGMLEIHVPGASTSATRAAPEPFRAAAEEVEPDLGPRLHVYKRLVARGLYVKTGFKFGTHFRVYDQHPDDTHAPWLVHVVGTDWTSSWPEVSRAVRLAHGVRKRFVLAITDGDTEGGDEAGPGDAGKATDSQRPRLELVELERVRL